MGFVGDRIYVFVFILYGSSLLGQAFVDDLILARGSKARMVCLNIVNG